jgi:hypothetical protein
MGQPGRPLGSKNKFPAHTKIHDELLKHQFDWCAEFAKLYHNTEASDVRTNLLLGVAPYLFPKRKPEDQTGDASETPLLGIQVTNEQLLQLVKSVRGEA